MIGLLFVSCLLSPDIESVDLVGIWGVSTLLGYVECLLYRVPRVGFVYFHKTYRLTTYHVSKTVYFHMILGPVWSKICLLYHGRIIFQGHILLILTKYLKYVALQTLQTIFEQQNFLNLSFFSLVTATIILHIVYLIFKAAYAQAQPSKKYSRT